MKYSLLTILLVSAAAMSLLEDLARAGMYRWVDEEGRVHYSDTIPARQARYGYRVYDAEGRQIDVVETAKTEEERLAAQSQAALAAEAARRDSVLLATFTSEEDLEYARDERLATLKSALELAQDKLSELQRQHADLEAQVGSHQAKQEPVPQELVDRLTSARASMDELEAGVAVKRAQKQAVEEAFASDLARYRELKRLPHEQ